MRLPFWRKLMQSHSGHPPKFQVNIEIQLNTAHVSRLSFCFLWLCLKWCRARKEIFRTPSLYFWFNGMNALPQYWQIFIIFIIPLPLNLTSFSKSPDLTAHIKINYETGCTGSFSVKHRDISRTIATCTMELFVALVISFQPLNSFRKNTNIGAMGVLNAPLEYYNVFIPYNLKYSTTSTLDSSCMLGISSYLAKQTLFTSKFSGS